MGNIIRVFEYEKLLATSDFFKNEEEGKRIIDKLWAYNDAKQNIYFKAIRNGVKFNQYVGVIQIGTTIIEILPKTDKIQNIDKNDSVRKDWQRILLSMLKYCKKINVTTISQASLSKRYNSLLDLYFEKYLNELELLLHKGLIKKYKYTSQNILTYKGQIQFSKHIQLNLVHKERVFSKHQIYSHEHLLNQILLKGLVILKRISTNPFLIDKVNRLLLSFPEINEIEIKKNDFDRIVFSRKNEAYKEAFQIAKMIILNYAPDIKSGDENMLALLFDMNKLWEEYVYRMLVRNTQEKIEVKFQNQQEFWNTKTIKPDLVINNYNGKNYVIDTKWKLIDPKYPGDDDLKQMYAYNMYWNVDLSMLLYPFCGYKDSIIGIYHKGQIKRENENGDIEELITNCKIASIKVVDEHNNLNLEIGNEILQLLKN